MAGQGGAVAYEKGIEAFRAEEYAAAHDWFETAAEEGMDTPQLSYNLGVSAYRLGRLDDAEEAFRTLREDPDWMAVATYNLGLVAERRQQMARAVGFYREVIRRGEPAELVQLASEALERLEGEPSTSRQSPTLASGSFLALALGHDQNATLSPDGELFESNGESAGFFDAFGTGRLSLGDAGLFLDWSGYTRRHSRHDEFDYLGLGGAIGRLWEGKAWWGETSLGYEHLRMDGEALHNTLEASGLARRSLGRQSRLRLLGRLRHISAATAYDHLDGWQLQLGAALEHPLAGGRGRSGYRGEVNERRNWTDGTDFVDYSPRRHGLYTQGQWSMGETRLLARLDYRLSRHPRANEEGGERLHRRDERVEGLLRLARPWGGSAWTLYSELLLTEQQSNWDTYDYQRAVLMVGVELDLAN
jgi:tetratricopeptide (TPR) repeat protein